MLRVTKLFLRVLMRIPCFYNAYSLGLVDSENLIIYATTLHSSYFCSNELYLKYLGLCRVVFNSS